MASLERRWILAGVLALACACVRRVVPLGILPTGSNPVPPPSISVPTLVVAQQTSTTVVLTATGGGSSGLSITAYIFQQATALGGPYNVISQQASPSLSTAAPTTGTVLYFRCAVIVSDGRQSDWGAILTVSATSQTTGRRFAGSHYTAIRPADISNFSGIPNAGNLDGSGNAIPNSGVRANAGPVSRYTNCVVVRYNFSDLNPTGNTFDFSLPNLHIAQCATFPVQELTASPLLLFMMVVTRTFDGNPNTGKAPTNPMPTDLQNKSEVFVSGVSGQQKSGVQGWRWAPAVLARFNTLCQKLGQQFNANVNFGGIATQETSTGNATGGSGADAYSVASFQGALVSEVASISNGCPNARALWYYNFINNGNKGNLKDVAAQIKPYGAILGGPDLCLGGNVADNCYQIAADYRNGTNTAGGVVSMPLGLGPTFEAIQNAEWTNGVPAAAPTATVLQRYNYSQGITTGAPSGTNIPSLLNTDALVVDWAHQANGPAWNPDWVAVMNANPSFATFTP